MATRPLTTSFEMGPLRGRGFSEWISGGSPVFDPTKDGYFGTTASITSLIFAGYDNNDTGTTTTGSPYTFRRSGFNLYQPYTASIGPTITVEGTFNFPETGLGATEAANHTAGVCAFIDATGNADQSEPLTVVAIDNSGPGAYWHSLQGGYFVGINSRGSVGVSGFRKHPSSGAYGDAYSVAETGMNTQTITAGANFTLKCAFIATAASVSGIVYFNGTNIGTFTDATSDRTSSGAVGLALNRQVHSSTTNAPRCSLLTITDSDIDSSPFLSEDWVRHDGNLLGTHTPGPLTTNVVDTVKATCKVWEWGSQHRLDMDGSATVYWSPRADGGGLAWYPWKDTATSSTASWEVGDLWQVVPTNADYLVEAHGVLTLGTSTQWKVQGGFGVLARASKSAPDNGTPTVATLSGYAFQLYYGGSAGLLVWRLSRYNAGTKTDFLSDQPLPVPFAEGQVTRIQLAIADTGGNVTLMPRFWSETQGKWIDGLSSVYTDSAGTKISAAGLAGLWASWHRGQGDTSAGIFFSEFTLDNDAGGGGGGGGGGVGTWSIPGEPASAGELTIMPERPNMATQTYTTEQTKTERGYIISRSVYGKTREILEVVWRVKATELNTLYPFLTTTMAANKSFGLDLEETGTPQTFVISDSEIPVARLTSDSFQVGPIKLVEVFP